jgi:hypothetical protein
MWNSRELWKLLSYWPNCRELEMQKGQKIEDKHAGSWGQVCWALRWRGTAAPLLLFYISSLLLHFFSLFFKALLLFYSLKSQSWDSHCSMFCLISLKICLQTCTVPLFPLISKLLKSVSLDSQTHNSSCTSQAARSQPINPLCPPSVHLLYTVANKEVEPQFSGKGMML